MAIAGVASAIQDRLRQRMVDELHQRQIEAQMAAQQQAGQRADRGMDLAEARFGFDVDQANQPAPPEKPVVVGGRLVMPSSGKVVYEAPPDAPKPQGPMTLSPGSRLVDPSTGRLIASAPTAGPAPKPTMADELKEFEEKEKIKARYGGSKPSLGAEKNALNYFNRMLEAERNARAVEDDVSAWDTAMSGNIPLMPEFAENLLKSDKGQKYTQAQRMFTEARLRKESGAAIPENEFANDRRMNFKAVGDKAETLAQKRKARLTTMRGIGQTAGRALQEYYGDDASLDTLLKEFEAQGGESGMKPIRQRNARTGQVRVSMDGGKTWQIQQ